MKRVLVIMLIFMTISGCENEIKNVDLESINNFNYDNVQEVDYYLHSKEYMIIRMSDLNVLYSKDADKKMYPASLTKVLTLDTVLSLVDDLNDTSRISPWQVRDLINDDASLAYIQTDYDYTLRELLYALILPSGADAAVALQNYFNERGINLIEEMNSHAKELGCENSNFVNTTGLHDDNHYTTLNDLFKILMDVLKYEDGRKVLESLSYTTSDGIRLMSSLKAIRGGGLQILGGKTGFTTESGQSVIILFKHNNRSYILMVANAMGNPYQDEFFHFEDAVEIINNLY